MFAFVFIIIILNFHFSFGEKGNEKIEKNVIELQLDKPQRTEPITAFISKVKKTFVAQVKKMIHGVEQIWEDTISIAPISKDVSKKIEIDIKRQDNGGDIICHGTSSERIEIGYEKPFQIRVNYPFPIFYSRCYDELHPNASVTNFTHASDSFYLSEKTSIAISGNRSLVCQFYFKICKQWKLYQTKVCYYDESNGREYTDTGAKCSVAVNVLTETETINKPVGSLTVNGRDVTTLENNVFYYSEGDNATFYCHRTVGTTLELTYGMNGSELSTESATSQITRTKILSAAYNNTYLTCTVINKKTNQKIELKAHFIAKKQPTEESLGFLVNNTTLPHTNLSYYDYILEYNGPQTALVQLIKDEQLYGKATCRKSEVNGTKTYPLSRGLKGLERIVLNPRNSSDSVTCSIEHREYNKLLSNSTQIKLTFLYKNNNRGNDGQTKLSPVSSTETPNNSGFKTSNPESTVKVLTKNGNTMMVVIACVVLLIAAVAVVWAMVHFLKLKKHKRRLQNSHASDIDYQNLPYHNEGPMAMPAQWNTQNEYVVPDSNLDQMYAKPVPKSLRKHPDETYSEVNDVLPEPTYASVEGSENLLQNPNLKHPYYHKNAQGPNQSHYANVKQTFGNVNYANTEELQDAYSNVNINEYAEPNCDRSK